MPVSLTFNTCIHLFYVHSIASGGQLNQLKEKTTLWIGLVPMDGTYSLVLSVPRYFLIGTARWCIRIGGQPCIELGVNYNVLTH